MTEKRKRPPVDPKWQEFIDQAEKQTYFKDLKEFVSNQRNSSNVYPKPIDVFNAFRYTPYDKVKVVILGQDPYHSPNTAHGLSFSSMQEKTPPSLYNVFKEIAENWYGIKNNTWPFKHNNLTQWAAQGVLLLNTVLTVQQGEAKSHAGQGWEKFTVDALKYLNDSVTGKQMDGNIGKKKIVFMLWGKQAQDLGEVIDDQRHVILRAAHPSPYSASNGFFGCDHFTKCNEVLHKHGQLGINWGVHEVKWAREQYGY